MSLPYFRFDPPHLLAEYADRTGPNLGNALPFDGYEALSEAKTSGNPPRLAVIGEWRDPDGTRYLDLGVTLAWLGAATNYRVDPTGALRWTCPSCAQRSGKHAKACDYE